VWLRLPAIQAREGGLLKSDVRLLSYNSEIYLRDAGSHSSASISPSRWLITLPTLSPPKLRVSYIVLRRELPENCVAICVAVSFARFLKRAASSRCLLRAAGMMALTALSASSAARRT
jgi:hypothetical protein